MCDAGFGFDDEGLEPRWRSGWGVLLWEEGERVRASGSSSDSSSSRDGDIDGGEFAVVGL